MIKRTENEWLWCFADEDVKKWCTIICEKLLYIPNWFRDIFNNSWLVEYTWFDSTNPNYFIYFTWEVRYINNAFDEANCRLMFDSWTVLVVAKRDIKAWEQLYLDYTDW